MRTIFHLFTILISMNSFSQEICQNWENYSNFDWITSVQENDDFVYVGSYGGLVVWNKNSDVKTYYNRGNSNIQSNGVFDLFLDTSDILWIATDQGTCRFVNGIFESNQSKNTGYWVEPLDNSTGPYLAGSNALFRFMDNGSIHEFLYPHWNAGEVTVAVDYNTNSYFIGLINWFAPSALIQFKDNEWQAFNGNNYIHSGNYYESILHKTKNDEILYFANDSIHKVNNEIVESQALSEFIQIENFEIRWIENGGDNVMYVYGLDQESQRYLFEIENDTWTEINLFNAPDIDFTIQFSNIENEFWVLSRNSGLYATNDFVDYSQNELQQSEITSNNVRQIVKSNVANYLLTGSNDIIKIENEIWKIIEDIPSFGNYTVDKIAISDNKLFATKDSELYAYDDEDSNWDLFYLEPNGNDLDLLESDMNGGVWMNASSKLLHFSEPNEVQSYGATEHQISGTIFKDIAVGNNGDVWVASFDGLSRFKDAEWVHFQNAGEGTSSQFYSIALDENSDLWFRGASGFGTYINEDFVLYDLQDSSEFIYNQTAMTFSSEGIILLGGNEQIYQFKDENWEAINMVNSCLQNGYINDLVYQENGDLWIATSGGGLSILIQGNNASAIDNPQHEERLLVYPNPVREFINLNMNHLPLQWKITDLAGRVVKVSGASFRQHKIDVSSLQKGSYLLFLYNENGQLLHDKFVKY